MRLVTASLVGVLVVMPLSAQDPEMRQREHVVRTGDTLWDLAGHYFRNPFGWRTIYEANTAVVEDPHWIYPDEVLVIPGMMERVEGGADPTPFVAVRPVDRPLRTVFYRGAEVAQDVEATILTEPGRERVPVRPGEFYSAEFLANPAALPVMGRMIRSARNIEMAGQETRPTAHPRDIIYIGYSGSLRPAEGDRVLMVRPGRRVSEAGRDFRVIHPTAVVRVLSLQREVIEGQIENQFEAVQIGQLVTPLDLYPDFMVEAAEPVEGAGDLEGRVVEFVHEQPLYGRTERGFLNLGRSHGVQPGDIFMAYLPERRSRRREGGEAWRWSYIERLPPEAVAELRIVRVTDTHATFQVDRVVLPVLEDGIRVRRIRKMP